MCISDFYFYSLWRHGDEMINVAGAGSVITAGWNWICCLYRITTCFLPSSLSVLFPLPISLLFSISLLSAFPSLPFIIAPYIRPSSAVTELEYRCSCQMERWRLPWLSAKSSLSPLLLHTNCRTNTGNKININHNFEHETSSTSLKSNLLRIHV